MKHILFFAISLAMILFTACEKESGGTLLIDLEEEQEDPHGDRCLEEFGIQEEDWSTSISDKSYLKSEVCERAISYFDIYSIKMTCVSVDYNSSKDRFDVSLDDNGVERKFWTLISGCTFRLATEAAYTSVISDMGYWSMDRCLCKEEKGKYFYRKSESPIEVGSNSSTEEKKKKSSSSSEKVQSSSSSEKAESSSSSKKVKSSSSSEEKRSSSSNNDSEDKITPDGYVKINSVYWMAKNLNVEVDGSMCYADDRANCEKYGRIYTWSQAMNVDKKYDREKLGKIALPHQGICPEGSHLPSEDEWNALYAYFAAYPEYQAYFTNQIGGAFDYKGMYRSEDEEVVFWTSTEYEVENSSDRNEFAWIWAYRKDGSIVRSNPHKYMGAYVRCVKNTPNTESSSSTEVSSGSVQSSSSKEVVLTDSDFVEINSQYWTKKNLDIAVESSMCYGDDPANCEKYGRIYTWSQAMNIDKKYDREKLGEIPMPHQGICPEGTHLPSYQEWDNLHTYIAEHTEYKVYFMNQIGGAFDYRGMYRSEDDEVVFWSSTEYEVDNSYYKFEYAWIWAYRKNGSAVLSNPHKYMGAYVRCIKNSAP